VKRVSPAVRTKAEKIRLLLLDVDGVLTDGQIVIDDKGVETKHFDVRDGQGISLLKHAGVDVGFITARSSKIMQYRAQELGIDLLYQGIRDKAGVYDKIKGASGLKDDEIAYVGDDIVDLPILRRAGLAISVKDGWAGLRPLVDYVTEATGGRGAVREIAELLLKAQRKWADVIRQYSAV
jgi:3-deoxy-D-manno-octulosonate 8-phosphate phosphatase (KDO 8-P phosphatase)